MSRANPSTWIEQLPTEYCYQPLLGSKPIRLLQLCKEESSDHVLVIPMVFELAECPSFEALSYAWGDPTERYTIHMCNIDNITDDDGEPPLVSSSAILPHEVSKNLYDALLQISDHEDTFWWIDALCINQQDDEEKGKQVAMMSEIYSQATSVRVWLGPEDPASVIAFDWLEAEASRTAEDVKELAESLVDVVQGKPTKAQRQLMARNYEDQAKIEISVMEMKAIVVTFSAKLSRKWWERRWVIQEIAHAQDVKVQCGKRTVKWWDMAMAMRKIRITICRDNRFERTHPQICRALKEIYRTITNWRNPRRDKRPREMTDNSLRGLLVTYISYKFSHPHDAIYAILSLFQERGYKVIPDYKRPLVDVCIDVTEIMIRDTTSLDILCYPVIPAATRPDGSRHTMEHRPSWLPLEDPVKGDIPRWLHGLFIGDPVLYFNASGNGKLKQNFLTENRQCMNLDGFVFDVVELLYPGLIRYRDVKYEPTDEEYPISADKSRALICDCKWTADGEVVRRLDPKWYANYERLIEIVVSGSEPPAEEMARITEPDSEENEKVGFWVIQNVIVGLQESARFCMTAGGRYAWVPKETVVGDQLAIVMGSRVPFALRQSQSQELNHFTFIGAAWVSDVMDGELMEEPDMADALIKIILE